MAKLTDLQIRNAKPRDKKYKLSGGNGLTLVVMPDGAKYWRLRYRYAGKEKERIRPTPPSSRGPRRLLSACRPVHRQQAVDVAILGCRQSLKDVGKIDLGIVPVRLGGFDQAGAHGAGFAAFLAAGE